MIRRFKSFLDREFSGYPESQQLSDLKEELTAVLMDKYNEGLKEGLGELDAYSQAVNSMADLRVQYKEQMDALQFTKTEVVKKTGNLFVSSLWYFLGLTIVFLVLQLLVFKGQNKPVWLIWPFGALVYVIAFLLYVNFNAKLSKGNITKTLTIYGVSVISALIIFLALGFFADLWHPAWLMMLVGVAVACILNGVLTVSNKIAKIVLIAAGGILCAVIIHLGLLFIFKISEGWLIYLLIAFGALAGLSFLLTKKKK